jgi:hypothetical protein
MKNQIHQYVKKVINGHRQTVGLMLAQKDEGGVVRIGWSKVAVTKGDRFDKERGMQIAEGRINSNKSLSNVVFPRSMEKDLANFQKRCDRYFKDSKGMTVLCSK